MQLRTTIPNKAFWSWFTALWLLGVAVYAAYLLLDVTTALAADNWPRAAATITTSQVISRPGRRSSRNLTAEISYTYTVGGKLLSNSSISPIRLGAAPHAVILVSRFPQDTTAEAAINPDDPSEAYLQTGFRWSMASSMLILLPTLCIGIAAAFMSFLRRTPNGAGFIGSYTVYPTPLPRLVTLQLPASAVGLLWAAITGGIGILLLLLSDGFVPTWNSRTVIPPGINPGVGDLPWLVPATVAASALAGVCGYLWRHRQLSACQHEIVIDVARELLITPKSWTSERRAIGLSEITHFTSNRIETQFGTKKQVRFDVCPMDKLGNKGTKLLSCSSTTDASAVVLWLNESTGADLETIRPIHTDITE